MFYNFRFKCFGRRRRRYYMVSVFCFNILVFVVVEIKEGDSDRDIGNDWVFSFLGIVDRKWFFFFIRMLVNLGLLFNI